jgi:2-oxoglutarate dehydrogenase E2 component (dihydrolipoamide succinyltransferase)
MKYEIKVPSMGESISEVTIGQILIPSENNVQTDAELLEIETDKINQVLYAPQSGKIRWIVQTGDIVKIGEVIGTIEAAAESISVGSVPDPKQTKEAERPPILEEVKTTSDKLMADKSIANEFKIKEENPQETRRPMSKIRMLIAKRMVEAQQTTAMLTTFNEIDMGSVISTREHYQTIFQEKYGCKLGFLSFFIKAIVSALQAYPDFNSFIDGEEIVHRNYYHIGVAVGTDKGVIVPIIRDCDHLSFGEIEQMIAKYAKQAREGTLALDALQGGGFTLTNGGVYGSLFSTPILIPPQCGILGMHKIEKRPMAIENKVVICPMMYVALSYDHRLVDGKEAVSFLVHIKELLEDPTRLLLAI